MCAEERAHIPRQKSARTDAQRRVRITADPDSRWWHVRVDERIRTHCPSYESAMRESARMVADLERAGGSL